MKFEILSGMSADGIDPKDMPFGHIGIVVNDCLSDQPRYGYHLLRCNGGWVFLNGNKVFYTYPPEVKVRLIPVGSTASMRVSKDGVEVSSDAVFTFHASSMSLGDIGIIMRDLWEEEKGGISRVGSLIIFSGGECVIMGKHITVMSMPPKVLVRYLDKEEFFTIKGKSEG